MQARLLVYKSHMSSNVQNTHYDRVAVAPNPLVCVIAYTIGYIWEMCLCCFRNAPQLQLLLQINIYTVFLFERL